jgi:hypothetical protein
VLVPVKHRERSNPFTHRVGTFSCDVVQASRACILPRQPCSAAHRGSPLKKAYVARHTSLLSFHIHGQAVIGLQDNSSSRTGQRCQAGGYRLQIHAERPSSSTSPPTKTISCKRQNQTMPYKHRRWKITISPLAAGASRRKVSHRPTVPSVIVHSLSKLRQGARIQMDCQRAERICQGFIRRSCALH